ncbi:Hypothetical protein R9X50_00605400 [Acrodontium crateriforme]|uniref:Eukaryotic mitochondrial regulator protein-domain-containing protein n=1 Tax=Acrodontium crateriforme TaxID=150365 RepID=A0AAQ3RDG5_9PEZI|nr:Hypothetical protein R9X50_00605400 [Acrodontium crateriforme]
MFDWLKRGPGRNLRDPLADSTNYLSAYDKEGRLRRAQNVDLKKYRESAAAATNGPRPLSTAEKKAEDAMIAQENADGITDDEKAANALQRAQLRARGSAEEISLPRERSGDLRPYPMNEHFRSQSVLSEELREQIYQQVAVVGLGVDTVASSFGVDMRRVAAVVRLKTIEKQWVGQGKSLAKPYNDAVLAMLPKTEYSPTRVTPHESINDLPVHPRTRNQLFYPTSESRHFTREDAAKAFDPKLLPADKRIPLPVLVKLEKWNLENLPREERQRRLREDDLAERTAQLAKEEKKAAWEARTQRVVPGRRWDFKFQDISAEKVGKDGRGRDAVGYRYGMPHEDRKRGLIKIPTSVE